MGRIPDEDVARVREATDIVSLVNETVPLRKKGRIYWGLCPFHAEKTPSFKVDPSTQLWHCFGCSEGGDAISFVMRTEHLEFADAVRRLADRARIEIHEEGGRGPSRDLKERLYAATEAAAEYYNSVLTSSKGEGAAGARAYLASRGFGIEVAKRFRLGYAPGGRDGATQALLTQGFTPEELVSANLTLRDRGGSLRDRFYDRVMFPIQELSGRVIGFGGRVLGAGEPKYLNTQETPIFHKSSGVYGLSFAKNAIVREETAIVVEGYTDVIALHEAGIGNAVATLGTALTDQHVRLLARFAKRIVYLFDGDAAGVRAATRAAEFLSLQATPERSAGRVEFLVAVIAGGKDPADAVAAGGPEAVREVVASATPLLRFVIEGRLAAHDLSKPEGRSRALSDVAGVLAGVRDSILVHDYANVVADRLLTDYATVQRAMLEASPEISVGREAPHGRTSTAGDAGAPGPAAPKGRSDPARRAEEALLQLLAVRPSLRVAARESLAEEAFSAEDTAALFKLLTEGDPPSDGLYALVSDRVPSMAQQVSGWLMDETSAEGIESSFPDVVARIREYHVQRRIIEAKAEMDAADPVEQRAAYDDAFLRITKLRRELEELRRGR